MMLLKLSSLNFNIFFFEQSAFENKIFFKRSFTTIWETRTRSPEGMLLPNSAIYLE